MSNLQLSSVSNDTKVIDVNEGEELSPKITQFSMVMAQPIDEALTITNLHHSPLQPTFSSQQLWLEDVARCQAIVVKRVHHGLLLYDN